MSLGRFRFVLYAKLGGISSCRQPASAGSETVAASARHPQTLERGASGSSTDVRHNQPAPWRLGEMCRMEVRSWLWQWGQAPSGPRIRCPLCRSVGRLWVRAIRRDLETLPNPVSMGNRLAHLILSVSGLHSPRRFKPVRPFTDPFCNKPIRSSGGRVRAS